MKVKKRLLCLLITLLAAALTGFTATCENECTSPDPMDVAQCLFDCMAK